MIAMTPGQQAFKAWEDKHAEECIPPRERALLRVVGEAMRAERQERIGQEKELRGMVRKLQLEVARLRGKA